jgi:hypothetical protein
MIDRVEAYCNDERLGNAVPRANGAGAKGRAPNLAFFGVSGRLERDLRSEARFRLELFSDGERLGALERSYRLEPHIDLVPIDLVPLDLPRPLMALRNYLRRSRYPALYLAAKSFRDHLLEARRYLS